MDLSDLDRRMNGAISVLKTELTGLRTGRASVNLLEPIHVDVYGASMPLNQVATVSVPESRMLGTLNNGWGQLMHGLNLERVCLAASAIGNMQRIVDYASSYARDRIQFGKPIASYQAVAHKLGDMQIMTDAARGLLYRST